MTKVLIIDDDRNRAERLERELNQRRAATIYSATVREAVRKLKSRTASIDLVILSISDRSQPWLEILHTLQEASWQPGIGDFPLFLCISRLYFVADFQLQIERMGARYVTE